MSSCNNVRLKASDQVKIYFEEFNAVEDGWEGHIVKPLPFILVNHFFINIVSPQDKLDITNPYQDTRDITSAKKYKDLGSAA